MGNRSDRKSFEERCLAILVVGPVEPVLTDGQIVAAFEHWIGRGPRLADLAVCNILGRSPGSVAEFLWDHLMGEPVQPTPQAIQKWLLENAVV